MNIYKEEPLETLSLKMECTEEPGPSMLLDVAVPNGHDYETLGITETTFHNVAPLFMTNSNEADVSSFLTDNVIVKQEPIGANIPCHTDSDTVLYTTNDGDDADVSSFSTDNVIVKQEPIDANSAPCLKGTDAFFTSTNVSSFSTDNVIVKQEPFGANSIPCHTGRRTDTFFNTTNVSSFSTDNVIVKEEPISANIIPCHTGADTLLYTTPDGDDADASSFSTDNVVVKQEPIGASSFSTDNVIVKQESIDADTTPYPDSVFNPTPVMIRCGRDSQAISLQYDENGWLQIQGVESSQTQIKQEDGSVKFEHEQMTPCVKQEKVEPMESSEPLENLSTKVYPVLLPPSPQAQDIQPQPKNRPTTSSTKTMPHLRKLLGLSSDSMMMELQPDQPVDAGQQLPSQQLPHLLFNDHDDGKIDEFATESRSKKMLMQFRAMPIPKPVEDAKPLDTDEGKKKDIAPSGSKRMKRQCEKCQRAFMKQDSFDLHKCDGDKTSDQSYKPYECETCQNRFSKYDDFKTHVRIHTGEKPFKCTECGKYFTYRRTITQHMRRDHSGEKKGPDVWKRQCEKCQRAFMKQDTFDVHKCDKDIISKPFECETCRSRFSNYSGLKTHMRRHTGEKPFECTECGKSFAQSCSLTRHMRVHSDERRFICDYCGYRFEALEHLNVHMRTHTGERAYVCPECGIIFRQHAKFLMHLKIHAGLKPKCNECDKSFECESEFKKHKKLHEDSKPFQYSQSRALTMHSHQHGQQKPFNCEICDRGFTTKSDHEEAHGGKTLRV